MAEFDELIKETKREIRVFLRNPDVRPDYMKYDQLRDVQSEICRMARIRDPEKFFPVLPERHGRCMLGYGSSYGY